MSDCLSWGEVSAQRGEEREESSLLRLMSLLPTVVVPSSGSTASFGAAELARHTGLFQFLSKTLLGSLDGAHAGVGRGEPPLISIECAEGLCSPALEKVYELGRRRHQVARPGGCSEIAGMEALHVHGGQEQNELFLWCAAPPDAEEGFCSCGFRVDPDAKAGFSTTPCAPRFAESACVAELSSASRGVARGVNGLRCLLLVRVLLGECLAVASWDAASCGAWPVQQEGAPYDSLCAPVSGEGGAAADREFAVRHLSQALPLFRITYRHEAACRCSLCACA